MASQWRQRLTTISDMKEGRYHVGVLADTVVNFHDLKSSSGINITDVQHILVVVRI